MNKRKLSTNNTEDVSSLNIQPLQRTRNKMYPCTIDECEFKTSKPAEFLVHRKTHYSHTVFECGINQCKEIFESQLSFPTFKRT
jgi:hypothetical protein